MSILQMSKVWALVEVEPAEKLVLLAVADFADDDGKAWPSVPTLAVKSGLSERSVQRILKKSSETGILEIAKRTDPIGRNTSNLYQLFPNGGGCHHDTIGVTQCHHGGCHHDTIITLNHQLEPSVTFGLFWTAYPRKTKKSESLKIWNRLNPNPETVTEILNALAWQCQQDSWLKDSGRFIPHPSTWLNGRRWEDERPVAITTCSATPQRGTLEELRAKGIDV